MNLIRCIAMSAILIAFFMSCSIPENSRAGEIRFHADFPSAFVASRNVEVFLPPGWSAENQYPVLYMHDGQNVFNPKTSYTGIAWEADKALVRLMEEDKVRPAIIVAIWNSPSRLAEYMPNQPKEQVLQRIREQGYDDEILSDQYLKFLVQELKPFIDSTYNTLTGPDNTFIMGSSMGGLISFYALAVYPEVFGAAACVSTHWPALDGVFVEEVPLLLPAPGQHRFYFDYGTATLDALYEPFQLRVDSMMIAASYVRGQDWETHRFDGAEHNENAWRERVYMPISFMLGR